MAGQQIAGSALRGSQFVMDTMKTLSLVKGKDHFCFRYETGQEAKVLDAQEKIVEI